MTTLPVPSTEGLLAAVRPLATGDLVQPVNGGAQLVIGGLAGIAVVVVLVAVAKLHPFLALVLGGFTVGAIAVVGSDAEVDGEAYDFQHVVTVFSTGFGNTTASVGLLIALGAMFAKLLADSGGADQVVDTIVSRASPRALPWAMAGVGALIGLPMFFEIGLVLLMPVIYLVARRAQISLVAIGIPTLAGLSAMHALVPPHPGPLLAIDNLGADLGVTLGLGVLLAIPVVIVAGPLFGILAARWVPVAAPSDADSPVSVGGRSGGVTGGGDAKEADGGVRRPGFATTVATVLLPVILMMGKALADVLLEESNGVRTVLDLLGTPFVALLLAVLVAMWTFGFGLGWSAGEVGRSVESSLPGVAGILLIVAAGGGFKEVLVSTGIGTLLAEWAQDANVSVMLLAWVLAVLIRLATGSATIATVTASSLMAGLVDGLSSGEVSLMVLAIGSGSVFFSHLNDAGFWLVKEYFRLDVPQTIKTWSAMETVLSATGLVLVLGLDLVI
ncbi:gluconate:H+ symporter [Nocardioides sp. ChNu-99]|uniref:GntP family permease n=1 Tax=Nocardioides sp. ChNu-99 TaxID=2839897 RepID=UPI002405D38E|nr:gluconate:H+ symporter [Nocardioides sp. ChNu-99]MDF9717536.1 GntP family permease [Nocardioides sp. ChNu-99]